MSLTTLPPNIITVPEIRFKKCPGHGYQRFFWSNFTTNSFQVHGQPGGHVWKSEMLN